MLFRSLLRLYDAHGSRGEAQVAVAGVHRWQEANFLEEARGDVGGRWSYTPFRVVTLREA